MFERMKMKKSVTGVLAPVFVLVTILLSFAAPVFAGGWEMYKAGDEANRYGRYERAIELLTDALESEHLTGNDESSAYFSRAYAYRNIGDYPAALADYNRALEIQPNLAKDYIFLGARAQTYIGLGNMEAAMADVESALAVSPDSASIINTRGVIWRIKKEYAKAIKDHKAALEISPRLWSARAELAWLKATCPDEQYRNGGEAVELAEKAVKIKPDHHTLDCLAAAYAEAGRYGEAVKVVNMALEILNKAGRDKLAGPMSEHLDAYQKQSPWRE